MHLEAYSNLNKIKYKLSIWEKPLFSIDIKSYYVYSIPKMGKYFFYFLALLLFKMWVIFAVSLNPGLHKFYLSPKMHQDYLKNQTCMSDENSVIFDAIFNDIISGLFPSF